MHSWDPELDDAWSRDVLCSRESSCLKAQDWSEKAGAGANTLIRPTGLHQTLLFNRILILS